MTKRTLPKRRTVVDQLDYVSPYQLECTLKELRDKIDVWIAEYGPDARLDWNANFYHDYDPSPSPRFDIKRDRLENDDELDARLAAEAAQQAAREEKEREEFARLAAKFGKIK